MRVRYFSFQISLSFSLSLSLFNEIERLLLPTSLLFETLTKDSHLNQPNLDLHLEPPKLEMNEELTNDLD